MNHQDIINYLEGNTSSEQTDKVQNWLKDSGNETEIRKVLGEIWMQSRMELKGCKPDFEGLLKQVHHLINIDERSKNNAFNSVSPFKKVYYYFSRIAAILLLPILLFSGYFFINNWTKEDTRVVVTERIISTKPGTRTKVELSDGTVVWLNDGTTLKYPDKFVNKERHVYVDGEAYFEVTANPQRPFIVENPMMNIRVTGTKFNLNAYVEDNYFEATLIEGNIDLEKNKRRFEMDAGCQIQYNKSTEEISKRNVNTAISTAWIEGKLVLQNESFSVVVKKLSRWYNVEIIVQSPELNDYLLTATIEDEKPEQTFKLIAYALPLTYTIKTSKIGNELKRTVYLRKK